MVVTRRNPLPQPLGDFADLYRTFAEHLGWHPRDVDELEVWEAASLLGRPTGRPAVSMVRSVSFGKGAGGAGGTADSIGWDIAARRAAAAREGRPQPSWED